jgi:hypothetical protein
VDDGTYDDDDAAANRRDDVALGVECDDDGWEEG